MSILYERPHVFQQKETLQAAMAGQSGASNTQPRLASGRSKCRHRKRRRKHLSKLLRLGVGFNAKHCHNYRPGANPVPDVFGVDTSAERKAAGGAQDSCRGQLWPTDEHQWWQRQWRRQRHQLQWQQRFLQSGGSQVGLYSSAKRDDAWPAGASDRLQAMAMARPHLCQRTETKSILPKPERHNLQLLQSRTLESNNRKR